MYQLMFYRYDSYFYKYKIAMFTDMSYFYRYDSDIPSKYVLIWPISSESEDFNACCQQ
jgi:hypothetical protein